MGALQIWALSAGYPHAHKIPPFRGGVWGFLEGGGVEVPILGYGRGDFCRTESNFGTRSKYDSVATPAEKNNCFCAHFGR